MTESKRKIEVCMTDTLNLMDFFKEERLWEEGSHPWAGCFVRSIGSNSEAGGYVQGIVDLDSHFAKKLQSSAYYRVDKLKNLSAPDDVQRASENYEKWENSGEFPIGFSVEVLQNTAAYSLEQTIALFSLSNANATDSMKKNFIVKILGWAEYYLPRLYTVKEKVLFPKFVFAGGIKQHEYLFCYFLHLLGCDIWYSNPKEDVDAFSNPLKSVSRVILGNAKLQNIPELPLFLENNIASVRSVVVPVREPIMPTVSTPQVSNPTVSNPQVSNPTVLNPTVPTPPISTTPISTPPVSTVEPIRSGGAEKSKEPLSYEELALMAGSVVMLKVYDEKDECFKSGSGVIISNKGYLLTNYHVIAGGTSFGIQFENDTQEYRTTEIIKCHSFNDLAILRVDRKGVPLKLYEGVDMIRGKQVVAIGSPLGLFNTVSNGIISGFRTIGEVSMIQFTAPTSHGSSGGALLDMHGAMIGIITAGYDDGQNLNLAVDYKTIYPFIKGFL